jgi:hypothetical protein
VIDEASGSQDDRQMLNCIAVAGLLIGFFWSSGSNAQAEPAAERVNLAGESSKEPKKSYGTGPAEGDALAQLPATTPTSRCVSAVENEIVVCARPDDNGYRLKPLPEKYKANRLGKPLDIEIAPGVHVNGLGLKLTF